jgi:N-acetyl-anhydromuramyl-L-alanine amidase AmpD
MLRKGDRGVEVEKLQKALLRLGYPLPRWGADADFGSETADAFRLFLRDHGSEADDNPDLITVKEQDLLYSVVAQQPNTQAVPTVADGMFHDIRTAANQQWVYGRRAWSKITGITLHQTACVMGERPLRWATLGAHLGVTREGRVIWVHDFEKLTVHAHGFNSNTVGIEMDGTYAGVEGDDRTFWRPRDEPNRQPQTPTAELVEAAKATVRWICAEVARHGGRVELLVAHRQASSDRQSDPGSALWQQVGMALHTELGLSDGGAGYRIGDGYAIPERWDANRTGVAY